ncbi:hypothetical protein PLICRDRAFT_31101 [Plicaturopsis crispa FD-325 SS-3]|nr:hypothetical protein PLICRDRAFT_31101 [Plicaturopsis crispa FD-325 SS-3]
MVYTSTTVLAAVIAAGAVAPSFAAPLSNSGLFKPAGYQGPGSVPILPSINAARQRPHVRQIPNELNHGLFEPDAYHGPGKAPILARDDAPIEATIPNQLNQGLFEPDAWRGVGKAPGALDRRGLPLEIVGPDGTYTPVQPHVERSIPGVVGSTDANPFGLDPLPAVGPQRLAPGAIGPIARSGIADVTSLNPNGVDPNTNLPFFPTHIAPGAINPNFSKTARTIPSPVTVNGHYVPVFTREVEDVLARVIERQLALRGMENILRRAFSADELD